MSQVIKTPPRVVATFGGERIEVANQRNGDETSNNGNKFSAGAADAKQQERPNTVTSDDLTNDRFEADFVAVFGGGR